MTFGAILALAAGLAADATAAAAVRGAGAPRIRARDVALVAGLFGGLQAAMPLAGWALGAGIGHVVAAWDHWIAFVLLVGIGMKTAREGFSAADERRETDWFGLRVLLLLAVATSIDAFAVGVTLPMIGAPLLTSVVTIGAVTALLSAFGLYLGRRFGALVGRRLDVVGGAVLIAMGFEILLEHLSG